jgi:hypothetical protein
MSGSVQYPTYLHRLVHNKINGQLCSPADRLCGLVSEFLATDPEARVRFPALPEEKSSESGTGSTQPREYN